MQLYRQQTEIMLFAYTGAGQNYFLRAAKQNTLRLQSKTAKAMQENSNVANCCNIL